VTRALASIEGACEVSWVRGPGAGPDAPPDLFIEIAHGAVRAAEFEAAAARLSPGLPADLRDFFFVNTDAGAPEYARAAAEAFVAAPGPPRSVLLVRSLIPRTFLDCNRILDPSTGSGLTAAFPDYITGEADRRTLLGFYEPYQKTVSAGVSAACGGGGLALMLHTYAPRAIAVDRVDEGIGAALRRAYAPERYERWERRPDADLITSDPTGKRLASEPVASALRRRFAEIGITATENVSYPLHPETTAWRHASAWPGRTLCLEVNRELLADPFTPFTEMRISAEKARRIGEAVAAACLDGWPRGGA